MHGPGGAGPPAAEVDHQVQLHRPAPTLCKEHRQTGAVQLLYFSSGVFESSTTEVFFFFLSFNSLFAPLGCDSVFIPHRRFCRV